MKLRNPPCWLVYHATLGPIGPWPLDVAFDRIPSSRTSCAQRILGVNIVRGIVLWLLGVPIFVIILLYLFHVI